MKLYKKLFIAAFCLLTAQTAFADKNISVNQLPAKAQTTLRTDFRNQKIDEIEVDKEDGKVRYEVSFVNGNSIEFGRHGNWKEIECKKHGVPMRLIPAPIVRNIKQRFGNVRVVKIEKDEKKFEIKLANGKELKYNQNFKVIDED